MTAPHIKPEAAAEIIKTKSLPKASDIWEHDALLLAVEALEEEHDYQNISSHAH